MLAKLVGRRKSHRRLPRKDTEIVYLSLSHSYVVCNFVSLERFRMYKISHYIYTLHDMSCEYTRRSGGNKK